MIRQPVLNNDNFRLHMRETLYSQNVFSKRHALRKFAQICTHCSVSILLMTGAIDEAKAVQGIVSGGIDTTGGVVANADSDGDNVTETQFFAIVVGTNYNGYGDPGTAPGTDAQFQVNKDSVIMNRNTAITNGGTLGVAGATTLSSTLSVGGTATITGATTISGATTINNSLGTNNAGRSANLSVNTNSNQASLSVSPTGGQNQGLFISGNDTGIAKPNTVLKGGTNSGTLTLQDGDTPAIALTGQPAGTSITISGSGGGTAATVFQTTTNAATTSVTTAIGTNAVYTDGSTATLQAGPTNAVTVNSGDAGSDPGVSINGKVGTGSTSTTGVLIKGDGQNGQTYSAGSGATPTWADVAIQSKSYGLGNPTLGSAILITDHGVQILSPQPSSGQQITNNAGGNSSSGTITNNNGMNSGTGTVVNNTGGTSGSGTATNNIGMNTSTTGGTANNSIGGVSGNGTANNTFGNNTSTTGGVANNSIGMNSGNGTTANSFGGGSGSGPTSNTIGQNTGTGTVTNSIGNASTAAGVATNNTFGVNNGAGTMTNDFGSNKSNGSVTNSNGMNSGSGSVTNNTGGTSGSGSATNNFGMNTSTTGGSVTNAIGGISGNGTVSNGFGNASSTSTGTAANTIGQNNGTGGMTNSFGGGSGPSTNNIGTGSGISSNTLGSTTVGSSNTFQAGNTRSSMANGVSTTQVQAGGGVGGSVLVTGGTTSGNNAIVLKDANAPHVVVNSNGQLSTATGPAAQTSASMTVSNGYGNAHGFLVNERQATISGGTRSSSLTLNDNGATFSNSATGAPIGVHGVADGRTSFDAVNVRQLFGGVAASMATAPTLTDLKPGESGFGLGMGTYGGYSAVGLSFSHYHSAGANLNIAVARGVQDGSQTAVRASIGVKF